MRKIKKNISNITNGSFDSYKEEILNDKNQVIEELEKNGEDDEKYTSFKYDENGNKVEEVYWYKNDQLKRKQNFKYDKFGNIIESTYLNSNLSEIKTIYHYEYDNFNNWIKKSFIREGKLITIGTRTIIYY